MMQTPLQPDEDYEVYKEILKESDYFAAYRLDILMGIESFRGLLKKFKHLDGAEHEVFIDANFTLLKSWVCIDTVGVYSGKYRLALFILLHHLTRRIQNIGTDDRVVEYVDADVARHERIDQNLRALDDYYLQAEQQERLERIYHKQLQFRTFNIYDLDLKSLEDKFREILQYEMMCEERGVWAIHLIAEKQKPLGLMIPKLKAYFEENHVHNEDEYLTTPPITFSLSLQDDFLENAQKFADFLHQQVRSPLKAVCPENSLIKNILIPVHVEFKGGRHAHHRLYDAFQIYCYNQNQLFKEIELPPRRYIFLVSSKISEQEAEQEPKWYQKRPKIAFPPFEYYRKDVAEEFSELVKKHRANHCKNVEELETLYLSTRNAIMGQTTYNTLIYEIENRLRSLQ